ncbi:MAG: LysM peptidoglycan-binding domain-containing protein [Chloroflexi bacterium]|nr:LysM peptidoglycan-binding domain-containing protein [Chloroflexota bacterium]
MHRTRLFALMALLGITLVTGPILGSVALAADPVVVVKTGDTLTSISKRHDVDIATIVELNGLNDPNRIYAGQRLRISVSPGSAASPPAAPAASPSRSHTVRPGEHLTGIARHYGVTIAAISRANGIADPSRIYAGQRLTIPGSSTAAPAAPATKPAPSTPSRSHTVRPGEHLTGIARHYGVTIAAISRANGIADPSRIYAGQRLTIPGAAAAASAAPKPAASPMPESMAELVAERDAVRRLIVEEADRYGVPPAFALAVAWQESGWQQGVVSHAGAVGVMQLMPATGEWVGSAMLGSRIDIHDTRQNVRGGVRLLAHYLDRYDGDRARVLAAYYQGQWATDHHGIYLVSRPYIASILELERIFSR